MNNQPHTILKRWAGFVMLMLLGTLIFTFSEAKAQVNVKVNISSQSLWGPVGYDYVEYYYIPEADAFYDVNRGQFIYWNGGKYLYANSLPPTYRVNLYSTYIVVVNEPRPYLQHNFYVTKYGKFKKAGRNYTPIRDSRDQKYYVVKGHPKHGGGSAKGQGNKMGPSPDKTSGNGNSPAKGPHNSSAKQNHKQKSSSHGKGSKGRH